MGNAPAELPLTVQFAELPAVEADTAPPPGSSNIDRSNPKYADLPPDATLVEYKIPKAPASYTSQTVESSRSYVAALPEPAGYAGPRYRGASSINEAWIRETLQNYKIPKAPASYT